MSDSRLTAREYAYVSIASDGTHDTVTARLGMQPSEAWNAGDLNERSGRPFPCTRWMRESGLDDTHPLEAHIAALLSMFRGKGEAIRALLADHDVTLQCVGYYAIDQGPGVHFERETVRQVAELGMAMDCDFYVLGDQGHGASSGRTARVDESERE